MTYALPIRPQAPRAALALAAALGLVVVVHPPRSRAQDAQLGSDTFASDCASCHGAHAEGGQGPSLLRPNYAHGSDDQSVSRTVREGIAEAGMPAFGAALSEAQIGALVALLHQLRAAAPPPVTRPPIARAYEPLGIPEGVVRTELHDFRVQTVAQVGEPYGFAFLPDGRILITEVAGNLRLIDHGRLLSEPVAGAPRGNAQGLRGGGGRSLLDVLVDPDYRSNGWIYLGTAHAVKDEQGKLGARATLNRGRIRDGRWVDNQVLADFSIDVTTGLKMAFDDRRFLYIGTSFPDPDYIAPEKISGTAAPQLLSSPWGKILRLSADGTVPADNPFVGTPGAFPYLATRWACARRWAWRSTASGALWKPRMGPRGGDELNHNQGGTQLRLAC